MYRKFTLIFVLAVLFGAFLIIQPYFKKVVEPPKIEDRLPDSDFMATVDFIRLAKEAQGMMYYYKVAYRDFTSPEFILAQAKNYGIKIQEPTYFFANKEGEFGVLAKLTDSTKLRQGLEKVNHFFPLKEIWIANQKIYKIQEDNIYLFYGNDYICLYKGTSPRKHIIRVTKARPNQVSPTWIELLNQQQYLNRSVVLYSHLEDFKEVNINQALAYPLIDSSHIQFFTYLQSKDTLPFSLKTGGKNFLPGEFTKLDVNLHVDATYLQNHPELPLYKYLMKQSARISFPFNAFISNWEGDLSFQQGGWVNVEEKFIESELDDDFNVTEVVKTKRVKVSGFSLNYTMNKNANWFIESLKTKGFLTQQENKYYLLFSPPLNFSANKKDNSQMFYATKTPPKMVESNGSYVMWTHKGTQYTATIDSLKTFELYGNLKFSMEKIFAKKNLQENF